jgi:hypothetical protein
MAQRQWYCLAPWPWGIFFIVLFVIVYIVIGHSLGLVLCGVRGFDNLNILIRIDVHGVVVRAPHLTSGRSTCLAAGEALRGVTCKLVDLFLFFARLLKRVVVADRMGMKVRTASGVQRSDAPFAQESGSLGGRLLVLVLVLVLLTVNKEEC